MENVKRIPEDYIDQETLKEMGQLNKQLFVQALKIHLHFIKKFFWSGIKETLETFKTIYQKGESKIDFEKISRNFEEEFGKISLVFPVVGTTLASFVKTIKFRKKIIDLCLVDEAAMIPCHSIFPGLVRSKSMIVVGDPEQLEPVISISSINKYETLWLDLGLTKEDVELYSPTRATVYDRASRASHTRNFRRETFLNEHRRCHEVIAEVFKEIVGDKYKNLEVKTETKPRNSDEEKIERFIQVFLKKKEDFWE